MRNRNILYWVCQIGGWGLFVLGNFIMASMQDQPLKRIAVFSALIFLMGVSITHLFRSLVKKWRWPQLNILSLLPRIAIASIIMSLAFVFINTVFTDVMDNNAIFSNSLKASTFLLNVLNFSVLFLFWNIIYFAVKTFENWKREEISNLELRAAKTEIELNSFKSQMNPHFMFNSLNSIRALVGEDPEKAKQAITMLSGILRNSLLLGKKQTVPLSEELDMVEKYLSLEKIRFEERLHLHFEIEPGVLNCEVPPFMIQTIAENGIKHGISRMVEGGELTIKCSWQEKDLMVVIANSGQLQLNSKDGVGLANTRKRLELLYNERASFEIEQDGVFVKARLIIPQGPSI